MVKRKRGRVALVLLLVLAGCSSESLRVALEAARRSDQVQQFVADKRHEALRILLYRDLLHRLAEAGAELNAAQRAVVSEVWNERDLLEHWRVQNERARMLRLAAVEAKLYGEQSMVDLLIKQVEAKADRAVREAARQAGRAVGASR